MLDCDRPACTNVAPSGDLYCSEECFELDHDTPVAPLARNKVGGFGNEISRMRRTPVVLRPIQPKGK